MLFYPRAAFIGTTIAERVITIVARVIAIVAHVTPIFFFLGFFFTGRSRYIFRFVALHSLGAW